METIYKRQEFSPWACAQLRHGGRFGSSSDSIAANPMTPPAPHFKRCMQNCNTLLYSLVFTCYEKTRFHSKKLATANAACSSCGACKCSSPPSPSQASTILPMMPPPLHMSCESPTNTCNERYNTDVRL